VLKLEQKAVETWQAATTGLGAEMATVHVALDEVQVLRGKYCSLFVRGSGDPTDGLRGLLDAAIAT